MPQMRRDPISGRWVVIAPERADRPQAILRVPPGPESGACPFCPGHEAVTPPELLVQRATGPANGPGWTLRVIPNKFPALRTEVVYGREGDGLYDAMAGVGAHEVIIETPEHARTLAEQQPAHVAALFAAYQSRAQDLSRDQRLRAIVLFKNSGAAAGATVTHSHMQLIAVPLVPEETKIELAACGAHWEAKERCLYCDIAAQELRSRERVVLETEQFLVLSPWAARTPFELVILPKEHRSRFEDETPLQLRAFAEALRTTLRKLDRALERPAFNFHLHSLPLREPKSPSYHWHLELKPTLQLRGGFEWGSGMSINPTPPEEAAAFLRQTEV